MRMPLKSGITGEVRGQDRGFTHALDVLLLAIEADLVGHELDAGSVLADDFEDLGAPLGAFERFDEHAVVGSHGYTSGRMLTWMAPGAPRPATASIASMARVIGNVCVEITSIGTLPDAMNWIASS